jgi:hypothetical protein
MDAVTEIYVVILALVLCPLAWLVANAARRKGRSWNAWFFIAFFFLVPAAIIIAVMKDETKASAGSTPVGAALAGSALPTAETKACSFCGESILAVAKKCKHCGEFLAVEV